MWSVEVMVVWRIVWLNRRIWLIQMAGFGLLRQGIGLGGLGHSIGLGLLPHCHGGGNGGIGLGSIIVISRIILRIIIIVKFRIIHGGLFQYIDLLSRFLGSFGSGHVCFLLCVV